MSILLPLSIWCFDDQFVSRHCIRQRKSCHRLLLIFEEKWYPLLRHHINWRTYLPNVADDDDGNDDFTVAWQSIFNWKTASRDSSSAARILRLQSLKVRSSSLSLFILLSFSSFCNFTTNREEPSSSYSSLLSLIRSWFLLLSTEKGWKLLSALMT